MKAPVLVGVVVAIHAVAVAGVMFIQGCGTRRPVMAEPPTAPTMPPRLGAEAPGAPMVAPRPVFQPPVAVEPAPSAVTATAGKTYVVANGDSLSKIASRFGVTMRELAQLNGIKDANKIRIGQKLMLPDYASPRAPSKAKPKAAAPSAAAAPGGATYVVQAGDYLGKIAKKHGVKISALREANHLTGDRILVGQKLVIPGASAATSAAPAAVPAAAPEPLLETPAVAPAPAPTTEVQAAPEQTAATSQEEPLDYTVQDGDTLESIAKLFIVRQEDIMKLNNLTDPQGVKPGQKLKIPATSM